MDTLTETASLTRRLATLAPQLAAAGWVVDHEGAGYALTAPDGRRTPRYMALAAAVKEAERMNDHADPNMPRSEPDAARSSRTRHRG